MRNSFVFRQPRLLSGAVLTSTLLLAALQPMTTSAAITSCRADPIVTLSNGHTVHITASMATHSNNVSHVQYTLHVPQGLTMTKVVYTGGSLHGKEQVVLADDQPANSYNVDAVATTGTDAATTVTAAVNSTPVSVSGSSNQHIVVDVNGVDD